jgi:hypothetical protein
VNHDQARNQPIHRRKNIMSTLLNRKPVLWFLFLFLFNAAIAIAIAAGGSSLQLHGSQQLMTAAGMGMVALGAGASLLRHRAAPRHHHPPLQPARRPRRRARIRLHDVRHTYATLSIDAGIDPKKISDRIGHASVAFTLTTYTHPSFGKDRQAAETFAAALFDSSAAPDHAE